MSEPVPARRVDIGAAFRWQRQAQRGNRGTLIGLTSIVGIIYVIQTLGSGAVQEVLLRSLSGCQDPLSRACQESLNSAFAPLVYSLVMLLIFGALIGVAQFGIYTAALGMTHGVRPTLSMMLPSDGFGRYAVFMSVYSVALTLGWGFCLVPALIVLFFFQLAALYVLDRGASPREALRLSSRHARHQAAAMMALVGLQLALFLLNSLFGALLGGLVGGLVTMFALPLILLVMAHVYRQINAEHVA